MKCPTCPDTRLVISERKGIEIDYCPDCRGVWLDRGELDKIIERTMQDSGPAPQPAAMQPAPPRDDQRARDRDYRQHDDRHYQERKHYRKKSLLGELFDF